MKGIGKEAARRILHSAKIDVVGMSSPSERTYNFTNSSGRWLEQQGFTGLPCLHRVGPQATNVLVIFLIISLVPGLRSLFLLSPLSIDRSRDACSHDLLDPLPAPHG